MSQQGQPPPGGGPPPQPPPPGGKPPGSTSSGMEPNIAALLCYVLGWLTGLIFFLIEKDNRFVRFHAAQSMVTFGGLTVIYIVLQFFLFAVSGLWFLYPLLSLAGFVLWIVLMVKAYQGEEFKLPIVGDIAEGLV